MPVRRWLGRGGYSTLSAALARQEIGYVVGSHPSLDRRMESVRAVVQVGIRPHQLVTIPRGFIKPGLPIILDVSIPGSQVSAVLQQYRQNIIKRSWLLLRMSDWWGIDSDLAQGLPIKVYRNAINVLPVVAAFLARIPSETIIPPTHYAVSSKAWPQ